MRRWRAAASLCRRGQVVRAVFQTSVDDLVARLREHDVGENAPKPGEKMPPFVLPDETGQLVTLERLLENGPRGGDLPSRSLVPLLPH